MTTGLIALGIAPAAAADLAARPYTKAPPMAVAVYNWSGFYAGIGVEDADDLIADFKQALDQV